MSKAVFLGTPCYGHIEVTLGLVHELVERGEQLLYYNNSSFQSLIEKTGCIFRDYRVDYGRLGSFQSGEPVLERLSGLDHLVGIIDLSIEENEAMYENIVQEIRDEKPDYILYDTFRYIGKRIAQELSIPAISTIPIFVYSKEFSCYYPQIYLSKILRLDREELGCNKDPKKILHLLYRHIENHIYQKFGLPDFDLYDTINCLSDYNIVFTSSSLLRDQEIYDERFMFAGCCLEYRERTEVQPTDARTCIVISLGTTYVNQQKAFYQKCLEAFGSLDMEIYMNIGRNIQPGELGYIPPNFILSSMLPQLSLLSKASLFITHGGANSAREALYYGVPMLIYPIDGDQFDVADRIIRLQCGEQYSPDSSSEQLYQQAMGVMENQTYSQNCFRMKQDLQQNGGCRIAAEAISKKNQEINMKSYKLMPNQHQYLCRHFLVQDRTQLNTPIILKMRGLHLEVQEIKKTVKQVLRHHIAFHTILFHNGQEVVQRIDKNMEIDITVRQGIPARQDQYIAGFVKPFHMMDTALVRVALYQYSRSEYLLLFDSTHLIMDGISKTIFVRDLIQCFNGAVPAEQTDAYLSFLERYREYSQSELHSLHKQYWMRELDLADINEEGHGSPRYRFDDSADGNTVCEFNLDRIARERIQTLAKEKQVTPYIVFLSILAYMMQNTLHLKTIVISGVFSIRQYHEMGMVGQCTNTLPVIYTPKKQQSILEFIDAYRTKIAEVHQNLEYPLLNYHQLLHSGGMELTYNALLETLLIYHNYAKMKMRSSTPVGEFELFDYFQFPKPLGMEINICETESDQYRIFLNFNNSFYSKEKQSIIVNTYQQLLLNLTKSNIQHRDSCDPGKIDWLQYNDLIPVHKQFEELVPVKSNQTALVAEGESITYGQVDNKARSIACFLQKRGIQKGDIVVLALNRSIDVLPCILGVLKLGAVFVVMNMEYGEHRIQTMISQLDVKLILSETPVDNSVLLDEIFRCGMAPLNCIDIVPSDSAYIMFTSGSTGVPKPVFIQHGSLSNTFRGLSQALNLNHTHMFLAASNISFDVSLIEMLWPLLNDKQVFIETGSGYSDPRRICELVKTYKPDILQITPSLLNLFLKQAPQIFTYLNCLLIGGEILTDSVIQELSKYFQHGRVYNLYGLTELAIWSTVKELQLKDKPSITAGLPICNTKIYILDQNRRIQKTNAEGTVCITGFSLGLLTSKDEESGRWFSIPELDTAPLYNTNDVGFIDSRGELTILGRMDNEIKYHGLRIQPIEIEKVLSSIPAIRSAVVTMLGAGVNQKIAAYLVLEQSITVQEIQAEIGYKLPPAFIPSLYFQIDNVYLNENNKPDLTKIKQNAVNLKKDEEAYLDSREKNIAEILRRTLNAEQISPNDNIFFIGGTSLLILIIRDELEKEFRLSLAVEDIYTHPTIRELSTFIGSLEAAQDEQIKEELSGENRRP